jgi:hypothetical protein
MSEDGNEGVYLIYTGQNKDYIPPVVTHVKVYPCVRAIEDDAFSDCMDLTSVILGDGLE